MGGSKPWRNTCLQSKSSRSHTRKRGARDKSSLQSRDDLLIVLRLIVELQIVDGRLAGNQATVPTAIMTTSMNIKVSRRLLSLIRSPELIADAVHCLEIKRVIRIDFDFLPQAHQLKCYHAAKAILR